VFSSDFLKRKLVEKMELSEKIKEHFRHPLNVGEIENLQGMGTPKGVKRQKRVSKGKAEGILYV
jgi:NifU-like protein involved in Fe-S cluster formation